MLTTENAAFCTHISMSSLWLIEGEYEQGLLVYEMRMF